MSTYYSSEYNKFGSSGWSAYRAVLEVSKSSTTGNAKTTVNWTIKVQMKYAWGYGVGIKLTGADTGSATGVLISNPGSTWTTVASKSDSFSVTGTTSEQTKKLTATAYGTLVSGYGSAGGSVATTVSVSIPALKKYTVKYNANGGTGAPSSQTKYYGKKITLRSGVPTRKGYTFNGWNTKKNGSGKAYQASGDYSANADVTLYAKWTAKTYKVTYNANTTDSVLNLPSTQTKGYDVALTISTQKPTRSGYSFDYWQTGKEGGTIYKSGSKYSTNSDLALYAKWTANTYKVTYNLNGGGGTASPSGNTTIGTTITLNSGLNVLPPSGKTLDSWNTQANGNGTRYILGGKYSQNASGNTTLYAIYKDIPTEQIDPSTVLTGYRIDSTGNKSTGGKRFLLSYEWSMGNDLNNNPYSGTFRIQHSINGSDWENTGTSSSNSSGSGTTTISESDLNDGYIYYRTQITYTDGTTKTIESNVVTVPNREIPQTIVISGFSVQRRSNISNDVDFNIEWEGYYDGNSIYNYNTSFKVAAKIFRKRGEEIEYTGETITTDWLTPVSGTEGISYGSTVISAGDGADFFITDFKSWENSSSFKTFPIDDVNESLARGIVQPGGFPVHISNTGEGISLFGIAPDTLNGLDVNGTLFAKRGIEASGKINANGGLYLSNQTALVGRNFQNTANRDIIKYNKNNNLIIGDKSIRDDYGYGDDPSAGSSVIALMGRTIYFHLGPDQNTNITAHFDTDANLYLRGHDGPIGEVKQYDKEGASAINKKLVAGTAWGAGSVELKAGIWVVTGTATFDNDGATSGTYREINISVSKGATSNYLAAKEMIYVPGTGTAVLNCSVVLQPSSTATYWLNLRSGTAVTVNAVHLRAVRIR